MKIGLIDVDSHNFPNLPLMKISAWHKANGDEVEWYWGWGYFDRVYMSKVFDDTYTQDIPEPVNALLIIKGGTGYFRRDKDGCSQIFDDGQWIDNGTKDSYVCGNVVYWEKLSDEIENSCPDYSLYPNLTKDTAYGFLTRGCPNNCGFCIVSQKEGRCSCKVADLAQWWDGQRNIVLCDPNLLACRDHMDLLRQLEESKAWVDVNQGFDAKLLTPENIAAIKKLKVKEIHFAWDQMKNSEKIIKGLNAWKRYGKKNAHGTWGTVYVLTNFDTTMAENLYRIYMLDQMGFDPYVMIYDKPYAPYEIRLLQRWCNNKKIFKSCPKFEDYDQRRGYEKKEQKADRPLLVQF